jgi:hypothetical protein
MGPEDRVQLAGCRVERLARRRSGQDDASRAVTCLIHSCSRFFIGLPNAAAAKVLGLSEPTVKRY